MSSVPDDDVSDLEKARRRARYVGLTLFLIHWLATLMSILLCILMLAKMILGENNPMIPSTSTEEDEDMTGITYCSSQMVTILALVSSAPQLLAAFSLLKGTDEGLKPDDAIKWVAIYQWFQRGFIFGELLILLLSMLNIGMSELVQIIGWGNIYIVALLQLFCLYIVDWFAWKLSTEIKMTTSKGEVNGDGKEMTV